MSVFRPVSMANPHNVGTPTGEQDGSLWWTFEAVHRALLGADTGLRSEYLADRDRVQSLVLESDADAAWQVANSWLHEWAQRLSGDNSTDIRPPWLQRYWQRANRQASRTSRLPWRPV
jgi:hypothetical protein